ncbi:hypothetical protein QVD17_20177 [Tagetes erecta]|uniref:Uncharacterized protein n=1 Tax=Tagetes erecta TaxID=13708 RepID=A0AAD8KNP5_TARER|nr:hypothetical protein QVD17_20177 [Tagetes erecta]
MEVIKSDEGASEEDLCPEIEDQGTELGWELGRRNQMGLVGGDAGVVKLDLLLMDVVVVVVVVEGDGVGVVVVVDGGGAQIY